MRIVNNLEKWKWWLIVYKTDGENSEWSLAPPPPLLLSPLLHKVQYSDFLSILISFSLFLSFYFFLIFYLFCFFFCLSVFPFQSPLISLYPSTYLSFFLFISFSQFLSFSLCKFPPLLILCFLSDVR